MRAYSRLNCGFAIALNGYGNMSTPATLRGKTDGEVRSAADYPPLLQIRPPTTS
jgi:hypothetical protein